MDAVQAVADHHECLALAPVAHRVRCKVLAQRLEMMTPMGKGKKALKKQAMEEAPSCAGKSLLEIMWEELDTIVERMMAGAGAEDDKGMALGVAYCIAVVTNPYYVNVEAVREEAMERWEEKHGEG